MRRLPPDLDPAAAGLDPRGDEGCSAPGDPVHARLGDRGEHLGVGPAPVEADHDPAVPDDLFELAEHLGQADRQPLGLARGKADRPPVRVDDEGVVSSRLGQVAADVVALGHRAGTPVGDEVVVDVEHLGWALVGGQHRLGERALNGEWVGRLGERLEAGPQGAQMGERLGADQRAGVATRRCLAPSNDEIPNAKPNTPDNTKEAAS